jgi:hypothetical protein
MATSKEYAWYIEGNQVAIVEKDVSFDNDINNKDYGPGASRQKWDSPKTTIADGLKVKYVYAPNYRINITDTIHTDLVKYRATSGGKLQLKGPDVRNYDTTMDAGGYIVLSNAGKFNGLHKINSFANSGGTGDIIELDTLYSGANSSWTDFEETVTMYYDISALEDESFELDLPLYLQKALVYYVKAKLAEDAGEIKLREYAMREFKKMIEKHENSKISGVRITSSGSHAIR